MIQKDQGRKTLNMSHFLIPMDIKSNNFVRNLLTIIDLQFGLYYDLNLLI